ncbi:MAG: O-antigen ligase family protein [Gemmatimonadota bacterium]
MESSVQEGPIGVAAVSEGPSATARWALWVLQIGAILAVLAAVTDRAFELDRFFIPKETVLHLTALLAGLLAAGAFQRVRITIVDALLAAYLLLGVVSTVFADDRELALRALAISASGVAVFWAARALREAGLSRPLIRLLALAVVLGAVTSLLQAYGVQSDFFSINRAPGGTLGNRNSIAHLAAFGLPLVLLAALRAGRTPAYLLGALGVAVVVASLVLTRSRAGWLAFAAVLAVLFAGMLLSRPVRRHPRVWKRLMVIVLLIGGGVAAAVLVPNSLRWRSENPYLESVTGIANYQEGSGRGRLVQYGRSLEMAVDRPLLGVGPGNWSEVYPDYAAPGDPSLSRSQPGATSNPWPSSDWVAFAAERGFPAALLLAAALLGIAASALRRLIRARDEDEGIVALALLATLAATLVAGLFDAVLLLAHPTLLVWAGLGALWSPEASRGDGARSPLRRVLLLVVALGSGIGFARSVEQLSTMTIVGLRADATVESLAGVSRRDDAESRRAYS